MLFWFAAFISVNLSCAEEMKASAFVELNFASDTVQPVRPTALVLFCLDICSKTIAKRKGLVRMVPDFPLLYSQRFPLLSS